MFRFNSSLAGNIISTTKKLTTQSRRNVCQARLHQEVLPKEVRIRDARIEDCASIINLVGERCSAQKMDAAMVEITTQQLIRDGFTAEQKKWFSIIVAENENGDELMNENLKDEIATKTKLWVTPCSIRNTQHSWAGCYT